MRFIPKSQGSTILLGQPVDGDIDVGAAIREGQEVLVSVFSGKSVLNPGAKTDRIEAISRLVSPLAQEEVGTIRCIGLNVIFRAPHMLCTVIKGKCIVYSTRERGQDGHPRHPNPIFVGKPRERIITSDAVLTS